ncbi:hypothetical protein OMP38_09645 [Cohnella ginsengisoli]|uniref:Uncharacterized protein n=1 Tax=Cohnella ginsengisoli TaxID=425004 RepID=A0A9X4QLZ0_9BACL|nr:hypothetical protein [Cohnella ginsengisoli]MDG0791103.1 hypothetical protein [Cohnella ginsengisoli]
MKAERKLANVNSLNQFSGSVMFFGDRSELDSTMMSGTKLRKTSASSATWVSERLATDAEVMRISPFCSA